jgi:hypothetical protein
VNNRIAINNLYTVRCTKGNEVYIIHFDSAAIPHALRHLGQWASNPELSFSWTDAAKLSQNIRPERA